MISFIPSSRPIAKIVGGDLDGKLVYLHEDLRATEKTLGSPTALVNDKDIVPQGRKRYKQADLEAVLKALEDNTPFNHPKADVMELYRRLRANIVARSSTHLSLTSGHFVPTPQLVPNQRQAIYVTGMSGSGKSVWTSNFMEQYHIAHPDNRVYIFSKKLEDPAYDKFEWITRVVLDEEFGIGEQLGCPQLQNSLCVFDDIESASPKTTLEAIYALKDTILLTGRSFHIDVITISHLSQNNRATKLDLSESDAYVTFRGTWGNKSRLYEYYAGLDKETIERIKTLPSRWVMAQKTFPPFVMG
jgi:hypothetical protein